MRASALLLAVIGLMLLIGGASATADQELPGACEVTSLSRLQSTVHLEHSALLKNTNDLEGTAGLEPSELPHGIHTVCDVGLWSGAKPKSLGAVIAKAKSGQGAQIGIETWAPNDESPDVEDWNKKEYDEVTSEFLKSRFPLVYKIPGKAEPLNPAGEGYSGAGVLIKASGKAKGVVAAIGCWWDASTHRDLCILDEEAEGKPVVDHLNTLAKTIVPGFLGAP
jgi:hypothetical protein